MSAHRGGAGLDVLRENSAEALADAVASDVDHVELDVQRCGDGTFVVRHDDVVADDDGGVTPLASLDLASLQRLVGDVLTLDTLLDVLAAHGKHAHLDLKLTSPPESYADPATTHEVAAVRRAIEVLDADRVVVTTRHERSVAAVRTWAADRYPDLLVGISLGGRRERLVRDLFPHRVVARSRANLVVAHYRHARLGLARFARRRDLPLLVWTVDRERHLRYWLRPGRAWLVTSNHPGLATSVRDTSSRRSRP